MNHKLRPVLFVILCIALEGSMAASVAARTGEKPVGGAATSPQRQDAPLATVSSAFTYQGRLQDGEVPAMGQYDLQFSLYDDTSGGNQVGTTVELLAQTVTNGLFTVQLDFGPAAFQGEGRWLEIAVRQAGGGSYTTLSPRQALSAAPYAMSLMPGAVIAGSGGPSVPVLRANNSGSGFGVWGKSSGTDGIGVYGVASNGPLASGVYGQSSTGTGVTGYSTASGFGVHAVYGVATGNNATGVHGVSNTGSFGTGVWGEGTSTGVYGLTTWGRGVYGQSTHSYGVQAVSTYGDAIFGRSTSGLGVVGESLNYKGVFGWSNTTYGVHGTTDSSLGSGVLGSTTVAQGIGVHGVANNGTNAKGVWGQSTGGYAGYFDGRVHVQGTLSKAAGSFKIDHPLDPGNKYLYHSFVESPDMMNIYNGNVTTDAKGEATVTLPDYFEALNRDFRYQLTVIGQFAQAIVSGEIVDNRFSIKTDKPHVKVSWQVTGIRQDPYAEQHRIPVVEVKPAGEKGKYLYPTGYSEPESKGVNYRPREADEVAPGLKEPRP